MSQWDKKIEKILRDGGLPFWILCIVFSIGSYAVLWLFMALGIAAGY